MTMTPEASATLRQAFAIAEGDPHGALKLLDAGVTVATSAGSWASVSALAKHAGAICIGVGDHRRALKYFESALIGEPDDSYVHLAIAGTARVLGMQIGRAHV